MENRWNEHSQNLKKVRSKKLKTKNSNDVLQKARALERNRAAEGKSPISKYKVVPSLAPKMNAFERTAEDDDSWGEESEASDEDAYNYKSNHLDTKQPNFPLPPMSFALVPVQHPGFLNKEPVKKPHLRKNDGIGSKSKHTSLTRESKRVGVSTETQTDLTPYERVPPSHYHSNHIQTHHHSPRIYPKRLSVEEERKLIGQATLHFYDDRHFAQRYSDDFINSYLHDEMIPDLLIELLDEMYNRKSKPGHSSRVPQHTQFTQHMTGAHLPTRMDMWGDTEQVQALIGQAEASKQVVDDLISDYLHQQVAAVVRETCAEFVQGFLDKSAPEKTLAKLTDEITTETVYSMFNEITTEAVEEELLSHHVTNPVVDDLLIDIAFDVIESAQDKTRGDEYKELSEGANEKFLDGIILENALEQILKQERIHVDSTPAAHCAQDSMILDILLRRMAELEISQRDLMDVNPVRKFHERVVTDAVMDLLLNELCLNIDEDMKDYDEYELELSNYLVNSGVYTDPPASRQSV